jgi:hypothetical protein
MKIIEAPGHEDFAIIMAEVKRKGWRVLAMDVGKFNSSWILTIDDSPPAQQPELGLGAETGRAS